ncbi:hypothetical protein K1719_046266, partial [Acacia pycnantha]
GKPVEVRQAAGLYLKNNLRTTYKSMLPVYQQYVKSELLPCLGAADRNIRSTVGTIISVVLWMLYPRYVRIFPKYFDSDIPGLAERPINIFLPRLFRFFKSPHASLRKLSVGSVNQYIMLMPSALYVSMDQFLQGLFILANDPSAEVRKLLSCRFWPHFSSKQGKHAEMVII